MLKHHAEMPTGPASSVVLVYFISLSFKCMKCDTLPAAYVPAAVGNFGPQQVPGGSTAAHVQAEEGEVGEVSMPTRCLAAPLGVCPLETARTTLAIGYTEALRELQCGN